MTVEGFNDNYWRTVCSVFRPFADLEVEYRYVLGEDRLFVKSIPDLLAVIVASPSWSKDQIDEVLINHSRYL